MDITHIHCPHDLIICLDIDLSSRNIDFADIDLALKLHRYPPHLFQPLNIDFSQNFYRHPSSFSSHSFEIIPHKLSGETCFLQGYIDHMVGKSIKLWGEINKIVRKNNVGQGGVGNSCIPFSTLFMFLESV